MADITAYLPVSPTRNVNAVNNQFFFELTDGTTGADVVAADADNASNTLNAVKAATYLHGFDGTTWDRLKVDASAALIVTLVGGAATSVVDTELPAAAALADNAANPTTPTVGAALLGFDGTTWDRLRTAGTGVLLSQPSDSTGVALFAAAAALADAVANPTVGKVATLLYGFNGTTWDRLRASATGNLQVDITAQTLTAVKISATAAANSATNPIYVALTGAVSSLEVQDYKTVASLASAATDNHDYASVSTTFLLKAVMAAASGAIKAEVQVGPVAALVSKAVAFSSMANPNIDLTFDPPIEVPITGTGTTRVIITNRELVAMDVYSTILGSQT